MPPGRYPHHVEIHGPTVIDNEIGEPVVTYHKVTQAYASIEPLRGREYWAAAQINAETTHEIKMRPPSVSLTTAHEIVFGTRRFEIEVVRNLGERNRELVILCKEQVPS